MENSVTIPDMVNEPDEVDQDDHAATKVPQLSLPPRAGVESVLTGTNQSVGPLPSGDSLSTSDSESMVKLVASGDKAHQRSKSLNKVGGETQEATVRTEKLYASAIPESEKQPADEVIADVDEMTLFETIKPGLKYTGRTPLESDGMSGHDLICLESVMGVTARVHRTNALGYNSQKKILLYAAGSTLVLWNWQQDTRIYLEGEGHTSTISDVAVTSHGLFAASASFETFSNKSYPTIVLWDLSGAAPGGRYCEVYRSRRSSVSDPACRIVNSMGIAFSPNDEILASICVCYPNSGGAESKYGTLQLCLFDWSHEFQLIQRCTIEGNPSKLDKAVHEESSADLTISLSGTNSNGSFSSAGVHIFAPEVPRMGAGEPMTSNQLGVTANDQRKNVDSTRNNPATSQKANDEQAYICWCGSSRLAIVYCTYVWIFDTASANNGGGLELKHHRNLKNELSSKDNRSSFKPGRSKSGRKFCMDDELDCTMITGARFCKEYGLLLIISRSGRLIVCESMSGAVVNNIAPPKTASGISLAGEHFTTLDIDGDVCTIGMSSGSLWSLSVRELAWQRPIPFQKQIRRRLLGNEETINGKIEKLRPPSSRKKGWPVVRAISLPDAENVGAGLKVVKDIIAALYADHTIAIFELTTARQSRGEIQKQQYARRPAKAGSHRSGEETSKGGSVANHAIGHFGAVQCVCWHPERTSSMLLTCSNDQSVGMWQLTPVAEDLSPPINIDSTVGSKLASSNISAAPSEKRVQLVRILDIATSICEDLPYSRCSKLTLSIANSTETTLEQRQLENMGMMQQVQGASMNRALQLNQRGIISSIEVTAVAYHPLGGQIAVGCSHGLVRIYSTVSGRLLHMRDVGDSFKTSPGSQGIQSMNIEESHTDPSYMSISSLCYSPTGRYIGAARADGTSLALDGWSEWCRGILLKSACLKPASIFSQGRIEFVSRPALPRHATPRDPIASAASLGASRNSSAESVASTCSLVLLSSDSIGLLTLVPLSSRETRRAANKVSNGGTDRSESGTSVGSVDWSHGFEKPRLLCEYRLDAAVRDMTVHPSGDYLIALTSRGTVLIYHLWLGRLRGIIPTISMALHRRPFDSLTTRGNAIAVDPCGIYLAVVVPCYTKPISSDTVQDPENDRDNAAIGKTASRSRYLSENHEAKLALARGTIVVFYELLTGVYAGRIARRWPVGAIKDISWSPCGSRIAIATSHDHCASVYRLQHGMWDNIRSALHVSTKNPEFWTRHPLFLHPFRPLTAQEGSAFKEEHMDMDTGGGMTSRSNLEAMTESIDAILLSASEAANHRWKSEGSGGDQAGMISVVEGSDTVRTDRTGLATARKRLSQLVVETSFNAARQNVMRRILLPAN